MSVFLKHTFVKGADQDWSGVYITKSANTDPRDSFSLDPDVAAEFRSRRPNAVNANGYIGWSRTYEGDHVLVISYEFDTAENAIAFFDYRKKMYRDHKLEYLLIDKQSPRYDVRWSVQNGNTVIMLGRNDN